ncbi:MAG: hypothetical protein ACFFEY_10195 [Candidatus Thorarchaeota archaeon]
MKNKKILLGVVLGLLVVCFVPSILGHGTISRSLKDDWLLAVDGVSPLNDHIGYWASEQLVICPHREYDPYWNFVSILDCDYHGHLFDRELPDGRHMITVFIQVKGAPVLVETYDPDPSNIITLFTGKMDYIFQLRFIVDLVEWPPWLVIAGFDDDGFDDETGYVLLPAYLPLAFDALMMYEFGLEFISVLFTGTAKGEMVNDWNGLELGDTAKVVGATYGSAKMGYNFIDPYWPIWPCNFIKLF